MLNGKQERETQKLHQDRKKDQRRDGEIVEHPHQGAAQKPEDAEAHVEYSKGRAAPLDRRHRGDGRLENRLLRAHADPPQDRPNQSTGEIPKNRSGAQGMEITRDRMTTEWPLRSYQRPNASAAKASVNMATA